MGYEARAFRSSGLQPFADMPGATRERPPLESDFETHVERAKRRVSIMTEAA